MENTIINGIRFTQDPISYFKTGEDVISKIYRIAKVQRRWYLSLITIFENPDFKASAHITTIALSKPPFKELHAYLRSRDILFFDRNDSDFWQDIILEFRNFGVFNNPEVFYRYLNERCKIKNLL